MEIFDKITSALITASLWNLDSANDTRALGLRGWGRWHDEEARQDQEAVITLCKLVGDKLSYKPVITVDRTTYTVKDIKSHHELWLTNIEKLIVMVKQAIEEIEYNDMEVYNNLCEILDNAQKEHFRVKSVLRNLTLSGFDSKDVVMKSKWLHEYFDDYKGGEIDFNIG